MKVGAQSFISALIHACSLFLNARTAFLIVMEHNVDKSYSVGFFGKGRRDYVGYLPFIVYNGVIPGDFLEIVSEGFYDVINPRWPPYRNVVPENRSNSVMLQDFYAKFSEFVGKRTLHKTAKFH